MNSAIPGKPVESLPGPILLDGLLQSFLLGTIVNQAFKYLLDYRDDSWRKRIFVVGVILLSTFQTILEDYKVWRTFIFHQKWSTSKIEWSDLFLNGCICWLCEGFYIRRCWKMLNKNVWFLASLSLLSALLMASNLYLAVAMGLAFRSDEVEGTNDTLTASRFLLPSTIVAFSVWIFGSLVLEMTVSTILIISLLRSRTGFKEIDKTVVKVVHMTWESAVLPLMCMLIGVGLYHAQPETDDHLVLFFVLLTGKFYTFGMLRTLNSRAKLRQRMNSQDLGLGRTSLSSWQWDQTPPETQYERSEPVAPTSLVPESSLSVVTMKPVSETTDSPSIIGSQNQLAFGSGVQVFNSPPLDAQEKGAVRHRACS
ncbi:hypothetical protein BDN70DRAFT_65061 [Pholiota conissans]|uniref:DUF6534 domain-containing protein n=1 Tax=Pholiota conissans TaxID=109636 RepID=A0A9P5YYM6_9AGAR|nr:hypothetical protein BDN70DRAFT_65061 [Pholiota conissans]